MTYGIAIYGCGAIGKVHAYCYNNLSFFYAPPALKTELVGVCTSSQETANTAKETLGFRFATTDYRDLLNSDDIQIVHCCTPNYLHKDFLIAAIKADKHIYCEKPIALNLEEAEEVLAVAKKNNYNKKFQMTFNYRYFPATMRAKQLIDAGFLDKVFGFRAQYLHSGYDNENKPLSWRLDIKKSGSGALGDLGTHVLDLIYYLLGPYARIMADSETFIKERPIPGSLEKGEVKVDDVTIGMARMKDGGMGTIEAWRLATGTEDDLRFEIHGSKGALRFNLMKPNWLEVYDNRESGEPLGGNRGWKKISTMQKYPMPAIFPSSKAPIGWLRSHLESIHSFLTTIREDSLPVPSLEDGVYIQRVHDMMLKSVKTGEWTAC